MPPFLGEFFTPAFEKEECKILLSSFPHALKFLSLKNDLKTKGETLRELDQHFPSQLIFMEIDDNLRIQERDIFLSGIHEKYLDVDYRGNKNDYSNILRTFETRYVVSMNAVDKFDSSVFKNFIFPPSFHLQKVSDKEEFNKFLTQTTASQLKYVKSFILEQIQIDQELLVKFLEKLPPIVQTLALRNVGIKPQDVEKIIQVLPKNLRRLNISQNPIGEEGFKKFRDFKKAQEEKSGLPFSLVEITIFN